MESNLNELAPCVQLSPPPCSAFPCDHNLRIECLWVDKWDVETNWKESEMQQAIERVDWLTKDKMYGDRQYRLIRVLHEVLYQPDVQGQTPLTPKENI